MNIYVCEITMCIDKNNLYFPIPEIQDATTVSMSIILIFLVGPVLVAGQYGEMEGGGYEGGGFEGGGSREEDTDHTVEDSAHTEEVTVYTEMVATGANLKGCMVREVTAQGVLWVRVE